MQRHNSFTSLHSLSSSRSNTTDYVRDSSTGVLLDDRKFVKKSRKVPASSSKSAYNFPNGETFTPRTTPSKRNKPARLASYPNRPLTKTPSVVSVHSATSASPNYTHSHNSSHLLPHLKHSDSFSNLKEKSKQSLMDSIRTNRLDTPTNIVLPSKTTASVPVSTRHTYSLTNNRYCENSSNIVRNESLVSESLIDTTAHLRLSTSDSDPSSISNYNCSGINTPQTSVSGSEVASDMSRLEGSTESVSSFINAKETCSLKSIKETHASDFPPAQDMSESLTISSSSASPSSDTQKDNFKSTETDIDTGESANGASNTNESTVSQPLSSSTKRTSAKAGKPRSGSSSSSGSSYRSFSDADDIESISHKGKASDGDSLSLSERQAPEDHETPESKDPTDNQHEGDEGSIGSSNNKKVPDAALSDSTKSDSESDRSEAENNLDSSRECSPEIDENPSPAVSSVNERKSTLADHRRSTADLPEPTIMLEPPARDTYLKVGLRPSSERSESFQLDAENGRNGHGRNVKGLTLPLAPSSETPIDKKLGTSTPHLQTSAPPTPISKSSAPPTPISKSTAPPTPISKDSAPATPIEVISERESVPNGSMRDAGSIPDSNQVSEDIKSKISKTVNSETTRSTTSYSPGESEISVRKIPCETQQPKAPYRSMLLPEPETSKTSTLSSQQQSSLQPSLKASQLQDRSPEAPSPISKDSAYNQQVDSVSTKPIDEEKEFGTDSKVDSKDVKKDEFAIGSDDSLPLDGNEYYSPVQIDKFFADEQEEVPPRGDIDVNNGFIKVHKRNNSSIGSTHSMQMKPPPVARQMPERSPKSVPNFPRYSPIKKPFSPTAARYSMLAVVDVDYDKSLPGTPYKDKRVSKMHRDFQNSLNFDVETASKDSLTDTVASSPACSPEKKSMLKKFSRFLSSGTKERIPRMLNHKSSTSSMNTSSVKVNENESINTKDTRSNEKTKVPKAKSSSSFTTKGRKRGLFLNLKLGSSSRVDDLPSPVYSVREKQSQGEASKESTPTIVKFDLPNYEVENDVFNDVLMRFDEVEKEVEKDLIKLRKGNSIRDFFAKDDELTNDQIVDQKRKDNHQSEESLLSKLSSANSSYENVSAAGAKSMPHDCYSGITDDIIAQMKSEDMASEFPPNESEKTVCVKQQQLQSAYNEPKGVRKSYLHLAKQFADFQEVEIKLKGFEPFRKSVRESDDVRSNSEVSERQSILRRESGSRSPTRSVRFSNSISISETYAPYMYKRNNKAVTQYYVNDLNEISKIKNELNAFKCYEMLVHEKSQTNTQFFY